jgi:hypothetical protein
VVVLVSGTRPLIFFGVVGLRRTYLFAINQAKAALLEIDALSGAVGIVWSGPRTSLQYASGLLYGRVEFPDLDRTLFALGGRPHRVIKQYATEEV